MIRTRIATLLALLITGTAGCSSPTTHTGNPSTTSRPATGNPAQTTHTIAAVPASADPAATIAAVRFVALWARPNLDPPTWLAAVTPAATPRYAALLATVDPARVPAGSSATATAAGPSDAVVLTATPDSAVLVVSVRGGTVQVTVIRTGGRWLVDDVQPGAPA
ncbi:hypothetical protein [Dactylosporangium darangshiense]|uniref:Lipoprotein n=1 Tax=Dactylosporangium darangshiense TaxID=579108 RepID=A0ABP8DI80_9ACTN